MKSAPVRWVGFLSALLATVAFATSTTEAAPSAEAIRGDVPTVGVGLGLLTTELPPADVVASLALRGCNARTIGAVQSGALRTYVAGAPAFVNVTFPPQSRCELACPLPLRGHPPAQRRYPHFDGDIDAHGHAERHTERDDRAAGDADLRRLDHPG